MNHLIYITKTDGTRQLFEEEKLVNSLSRVGASPEAIEDVVDEVESEMRDGMPTDEIYAKAFELLKRHSVQTAVKYSIRRALMELGPDGFPFEKFVARIFKTWGYDVATDQILLGKCVDHEIDVVAWKPGDDSGVGMVEAKFHNQFGLKSDLKVVLYVKARFDDLSETEFDFGGKKRKLSERWLITNTKFTDKAVIYGGCQNLKLVGWNYPDKPGPNSPGNLHQIIESNGLHPITCLTSINRDQKKELIKAGVLVCSDIVSNTKVMENAGIKPDAINKVVLEADFIIKNAK